MRKLLAVLALALGLTVPIAAASQPEPAEAYISGCSVLYEGGGSWARARCTNFNTLNPIQNQWLASGKCWKSDGSTWYAAVNTGWRPVGTTRYQMVCPYLSGIGQTYLLSGVSWSFRLV